jgi:hypothetical protein
VKLARRRRTSDLVAVAIDPRQRRVLASLPAWRTDRDHQSCAKASVEEGAIGDVSQWPRAYTLERLTQVLNADPWAEMVTRDGEGPTITEHLHTLASMGLVTQTQYEGRWSMTELGLYSLTHEAPGQVPSKAQPTQVEVNGAGRI